MEFRDAWCVGGPRTTRRILWFLFKHRRVAVRSENSPLQARFHGDSTPKKTNSDFEGIKWDLRWVLTLVGIPGEPNVIYLVCGFSGGFEGWRVSTANRSKNGVFDLFSFCTFSERVVRPAFQYFRVSRSKRHMLKKIWEKKNCNYCVKSVPL